jgi:hypothetical protein
MQKVKVAFTVDLTDEEMSRLFGLGEDEVSTWCDAEVVIRALVMADEEGCDDEGNYREAAITHLSLLEDPMDWHVQHAVVKKELLPEGGILKGGDYSDPYWKS